MPTTGEVIVIVAIAIAMAVVGLVRGHQRDWWEVDPDVSPEARDRSMRG